MRDFTLHPCPDKVTWCAGHSRAEVEDWDNDREDRNHYGLLAQVESADSGIDFRIGQLQGEDVHFFFSINWWEIEKADLDTELADIRAIIDGFEAAARKFLTTGEVS